MDPHITPEGNLYQVTRVALARKMFAQQIRASIERTTEHSGTIIGAPARVNVLKLNLELDGEKPVAPIEAAVSDVRDKATGTPGSMAGQRVVEQAVSKSPLAEEVGAIRTQVAMITEQVNQFGDRIDAMNGNDDAQKPTHDQMEAIERKLSGLIAETRKIGQVAEAVDRLERRVRVTTGSLNQLGEDIRDVTKALKSLSSADSRTVRRAN